MKISCSIKLHFRAASKGVPPRAIYSIHVLHCLLFKENCNGWFGHGSISLSKALNRRGTRMNFTFAVFSNFARIALSFQGTFRFFGCLVSKNRLFSTFYFPFKLGFFLPFPAIASRKMENKWGLSVPDVNISSWKDTFWISWNLWLERRGKWNTRADKRKRKPKEASVPRSYAYTLLCLTMLRLLRPQSPSTYVFLACNEASEDFFLREPSIFHWEAPFESAKEKLHFLEIFSPF